MFKQILVATDLTVVSRPALQLAMSLAREQQAALAVAFVSDKHLEGEHWLTPMFEEETRVYNALLEREEAEARKRVLAEVEAVAGKAGFAAGEAKVMVRLGHPADTLVKMAQEIDADLMVVGTRGREGTLGSTAERVVRLAHRPVLAVPAH